MTETLGVDRGQREGFARGPRARIQSTSETRRRARMRVPPDAREPHPRRSASQKPIGSARTQSDEG